MKRIAITSYALANALGSTTDEVMDHIFSGKTAFQAPRAFPMPFPTVVGEMNDLPSAPEVGIAGDTRIMKIAMLGARQISKDVERAVTTYGKKRIGFVLGGCTAGIEFSESVFPALSRGEASVDYSCETQHTHHATLVPLADYFGVGGPSLVVSSACSSSVKAIAIARRWFDADLVDAVIVGGIDSLSRTTIRGFHSLGALSENATRPFSSERTGLTLGEGAGFMLLEKDATSDVYVRGIGESSDAHHLSAPDPKGSGILESMRRALADANLQTDAIDYVSAHGTGTIQNDLVEGHAISELFGEGTRVTSTKSMTGHLLGAAGITSTVISLESLRRGLIPPTVGTPPQDPAIHVVVSTQPEKVALRAIINNAIGFGGSNAAVILST